MDSVSEMDKAQLLAELDKIRSERAVADRVWCRESNRLSERQEKIERRIHHLIPDPHPRYVWAGFFFFLMIVAFVAYLALDHPSHQLQCILLLILFALGMYINLFPSKPAFLPPSNVGN